MDAIKRAIRPYFGASKKPGCAFIEDSLGFDWHSGMSWQVRQRSSDCLARAIISKYDESDLALDDILEVSTASHDYETGRALSALNLKYKDPLSGKECSVENWFQSSKVFGRDGLEFGPYKELLAVSKPMQYLNTHPDKKIASKYENDVLFQKIQREIKDANLVRFEMLGETFPLVPRSCFYDFLYASALHQPQNAKLSDRVCEFRVFTDIMFNPGTGKKKKFNTQARSCAIFVSLTKRGLIDEALTNIKTFIELVDYDNSNEPTTESKQMKIPFGNKLSAIAEIESLPNRNQSELNYKIKH